MKNMEKNSSVKVSNDTRKDANFCMALGAGVGTFGATAAALTGAVCPLCIIVAPGLIGLGAYQRWKSTKMIRRISNEPDSVQHNIQIKDISGK